MSLEEIAAGLLRPGQEQARVCAGRGERALVWLDGREVAGVLAGALAYEAAGSSALPVTGDWVAVHRVEPELALIEALLPRRSKIARRAAGRRDDEQVLAANVDLALIVCGLDGEFKPRRLERYLAICQQGGVTPVVVLNKADVCPEEAPAVDEAHRAANSAPVIVVSAATGEGLGALHELLPPGVTAALLGSSGTGKSTLLNRLLGRKLRKTGSVRASDGRGRHTTTSSELLPLPNGAWVIDTPGLREIQLWVDQASVDAVFEEIPGLAAQCRFRDCTHSVEPGCAVRDALDPSRLESYQKLRREAERLEGRLTEKQRWRSIHKAARQMYKAQERERSG